MKGDQPTRWVKGQTKSAVAPPRGGGATAAALFLTQITVAIVNLPITILLARTLAPEGLGQYQLLNRSALIAISVACLGFPHAIAWASANAQTDLDRRSVVRTATISMLGAAALISVGAVIAVSTGLFGADPIVWWCFAGYAVTNVASANVVNFYRGVLDIRSIAAIRLSQAGLWLSSCLALAAFRQLSISTAAVAMVSAQVLSLSVGFLLLHRQDFLFGSVSKSNRMPIVRFSYKVFPGLAIREWSVHLDQIFIGFFLAAYDVGIYAVAASIALSLSLISAPLTNTVQPVMQRSVVDRKETAAKYFGASVIIIGIPASILAAVAGTLIPLVYGSSFQGSVAVAQVLCVSAIAAALGACGQGLLLGMGAPGRGSFAAILGFISSVVLWLVLIPLLGAMGAAWASVIGSTLTSVSIAYFVSRELGVGLGSFALLTLRNMPVATAAILRVACGLCQKGMRRSLSR
ncbi:oligosaccharide flippase family protein [Rhodococcus opacus]|uniref:Oligosaccharide flippase family protein n=1 Tax=Rhodococcus opacus TaxID=37919 RepID=A0AAX3YL35_RHOOP|nr:oligosaccharide flippase family protein [Rhodococcus opacus]MCZ4587522.1 oligosaccharide flippase family protein [Rhodococcus opacus]WLF49095.1 oligosaccharide flippase family protein [Rhodococcus opacus]